MAFVIDVLPIYLALFFVSTKFLGINPFADRGVAGVPDIDPGIALAVITLAALSIWVVYCIAAELSSWRGTYGKKILGIRVCCCVDRDKRHLSLRQVLTRNTAKFLSAAPFYLGFIWAFFTNGNRAWHDSLSKTAVAER